MPKPKASTKHIIVDAIELMFALDNADVFDKSTRRALRSTCRRLRQTIDGTLTSLQTWNGDYSEKLWTSKLLDRCENLTIDIAVQSNPSVNPDAVVLSLANAVLPRLERLEFRVRERAGWVRQLKHLFLGISATGSDCSIFDDLHFEECTDVTINHSSGLGTSGAAFWRCLGRCNALRQLQLGGTDVSEADFGNFLADQAIRLESIKVTPMLGPRTCVFVYPSVIQALAAAALPALRSVELGRFDPGLYDLLRNSAWLKTVDSLKINDVPADGLAPVLAGASGGSMRVLRASLRGFEGNAFENVDLPKLAELFLWTESNNATWDASALLTSTKMPKLERLKLMGNSNKLIIPEGFAAADKLPSLSNLELCGFVLDDQGAVALGGRLPRLTHFKYKGHINFIESQACHLLDAAAGFSREWALESSLGDGDYFDHEVEERPATLPALEKLIKAGPRMPHLKRCYFFGAGVGLMGAWALAAQRGVWPQLQVLMVGDMEEDGLDALAGNLGGWTKLRKLFFAGQCREDFDAAEAFQGVKLDVGGSAEYDGVGEEDEDDEEI